MLRRRALLLLLLLFTWLAHPFPGLADEQQERRIAVGLRLFPTLLAADRQLQDKLDGDGQLQVLVLFTDDSKLAQRVVAQLQEVGDVKGLPVHYRTLSESELGPDEQPVAGVFIVQRLSDRYLEHAISLGRAHHSIVFSPFDGDVERGVLGGISVTDRILPYINLKAMESAEIHLKSFYLRVADVYE